MALSRSSVSVGSVLLRRIGAPLAVAAMAAAIVLERWLDARRA